MVESHSQKRQLIWEIVPFFGLRDQDADRLRQRDLGINAEPLPPWPRLCSKSSARAGNRNSAPDGKALSASREAQTEAAVGPAEPGWDEEPVG
jgi:hypothetical protein